MPLRQSASTNGHGEPCGISAISVGSASIPDESGCSLPTSRRPIPRSSRRASATRSASSQFGYALEIVGMTAKLYSGGGEGIDHSSVGPRHGSRGAGGPRNQL